MDEGGDVLPVGLQEVDALEGVLVQLNCLAGLLGCGDLGALYDLCGDLSSCCLELLFHFLNGIVACGGFLFLLRAETAELLLQSGSVVYEFC